MKHFLAPISENIWDLKYRLKEANGDPIDATIEDTWRRIAHGLANAEKEGERHEWAERFYQALEGFKFLPAGRIIAGAGTDRTVTLFNCFVMGTIPDSMSGIFEMLKEAALTMQQGGGIGYDFSTIRPKGSIVKGVAADASGPLTFMDCWDSMCRTVMSAGNRRGAMMATMRCDHPDIEAFIEAKQNAAKLRMFNLSVLVTDAFMEAVMLDASWRLHFEDRHGETLMEKNVSARALWDKIIRSTYDAAEPGVIFIDRINQTNNLRYVEKIAATNPCGEQPLPPYGACLLGSINLPMFVADPFGEAPYVRVDELMSVVKLAVRMMDNVVDVSRFPLPQQEAEAKAKRRIGLGVTGLADMLMMLRLRYGSHEAVRETNLIMKIITDTAYAASVDLAIEKGPFPLFNATAYLEKGTFASGLANHLKASIRKHGIRNSHLTSIAPTGTISLYAGNVSSGIEPVFDYYYTRKVLQPDGSKVEERVEDYAYRLFRSDRKNDGKELPDYFVTAQNLIPADHLVMQSAAQRWIDSSISKTINVPVDISFEDFKDVYEQAYSLGCKGCTTYRPNDITGSILSTDKPVAPTPAPIQVEAEEPPTPRPDALTGTTYKIKWPGGEHVLYVTVTDINENGKRRPFEVFINSKSMDHFAWTVALTRMISAVFRRPHDSSFVVQELKAVFDPRGGAWVKGKFIPSILAAIGWAIEDHMIAIGYIPASAGSAEPPSLAITPVGSPASFVGSLCPSCASANVKHESGCFTCLDCNYSKCG